MKRKQTSRLLAGLLARGLAACSSTPSSTSTSDTASTGSTQSSSNMASSTAPVRTDAGTMPDTSMSSSTAGSSTGSTSMAGTSGQQPMASTGTPNSRVTLIETVPRTGSGVDSTVGGTGGSTATGGDRLYRVTVVMDDGTTRVIQQEWAPAFRAGDRVRVESGVIQH